MRTNSTRLLAPSLLGLLLLSGLTWADPAPTWTVESPKFPLVAPSAQWVEVEVRGPAGGAPKIHGAQREWPLQEVRPGVYRGRIQPVDGDLSVESEVVGTSRISTGSLGVFETAKSPTVFRAGPSSDFDRLTPIEPGVRLEILQRQGDYVQVSPPLGWIRLADGRQLPPETTMGQPRLARVQVGDAGQIRFRLDSPCAYQVHPDPEGRRLHIDLPGATMAMHELAFAQYPARLPGLRLIPQSWGTRVEIPLRHRYWGYSARWTGQELRFQISQPPRIDARHPLKGLRITLDAGHGGEDSGTVGLELKVKEKDLNLAVTRALRQELERAGARVVMTRDGDREVAPEGAPADAELQSRVEVAERSRSQLFISIHHNARPDVRDGRISHGTHIYYYQPQSRGLAETIAAPLAQSIGETEWMHLWRSFAVTRQTSMPSVLVEANFLSNPSLEKGMLRKADYPRRAAHGIRLGIERFLKRKDQDG